MTLQQLRYIAEIARCGSITAAAQKLFIAQPSLSKAVKDLENEIGITIFERSRRGIVFTNDGIELLGYANLILEQTHNIEDHFSHQSKEEEVRLSVSAQHYIFAVDAMVDYINSAKPDAKYTINIRECRTAQVINDVLVQQSQIGIIFVSNTTRQFMHRLFLKNGIEFTPFREFSPYVYLNAGHPLAQFSGVTLEQLAPYPYVRYEQGADSHHYAEELLVPEGTSKSIYVTDRSTMLSIIQNTEAYNIGSGCLLPNIIDQKIISLPLRNRLDRMLIGWIKLKSMALQPEMLEYVRLLETSIQKCIWGKQQPR